jgi:microcystin-dependent protein
MSNCSNCYNGCTEIVSDRCVKYTGIDVPVLGIQTGDSLSFVEQALITFLVSTLDGTGVKIDLTGIDICALVQKYLPTCGDLSIVDISKALIQAACDLQDQVDIIVADIVEINDQLDIIEANYDVKCLTVVTPSIKPFSGTHAILQATIDTLCALVLDLNTNYVRYDELDQLIQNYLDETSNSLYSSRMIPYAVVPYFGPIAGIFDSSGAGTGQWDKIYLCNGNNGAPDLRGRALTGVINGVPGPTLNPAVDPTVSAANPNYSLYDNAGANQITLLDTQIPLHIHANTLVTTVNFNDPGHDHTFQGVTNSSGEGVGSRQSVPFTRTTSNNKTGITLDVITNLTNVAGPIGGGLPHANIQPVTACYYIQYRPI